MRWWRTTLALLHSAKANFKRASVKQGSPRLPEQSEKLKETLPGGVVGAIEDGVDVLPSSRVYM